ncbi:type II toxin-antitoxin system HigB family toxin [Marinobacter sp. AC-23]|uniref:type II toxin-antitoxin system HigB family toxin n=1 Tax=Marinobacter sp. AC-23 TaxID=1879031 RepID=UPI0009F5B7D3|nr:type II toxin-antitoxin system HigB family toxin [Marinobacter sp. AC-23]
MRLIGRGKLQCLSRTDESARTWICAWVAELTDANWKRPADVSQQFPNARQSQPGSFIFPISNCNKEVSLQIAFQQGIAVITGLQ